MIELIIASIISFQEVTNQKAQIFELHLIDYEDYISYQLKEHYKETQTFITFSADIPQKFHERIREDSNKAGWNVSIEKVPGFNQYEETYKFTFSRL